MKTNATLAPRIAPHARIHLVIDAQPESHIVDVLCATTLGEFMAMARGGLGARRNPTLYTDAAEAERDARARLAACNVRRWKDARTTSLAPSVRETLRTCK